MQIVGTPQNVRIGDILDIRDGTHDTPKYVESGIPLITSKNLTDNGLSFESASFISESDHLEISKRSGVNRGDILYGMIGTIGKPTLVDTDRLFSIKNVALFKHSGDRIDPQYLLWLLQSDEINRQIESSTRGGTQKFVSLGVLRGLRATIPSLTEQRRIAAILDKANALRTKRREALAQLDRLAQSIFVEMFGDPATNPNGWAIRTLTELGKVSTGGTPPSSLDGMFGGDIPFVTPGDLESGQPVRRTVTEAGAQAAGTVRAGASFVCCIGATIGKMGIASMRSSFNQQLNSVEWHPTSIDDCYGLAALRFFKPTIIAWGASTTLPILKKSSFEKVAIPVPPLSLQQQFAKKIAALENWRVGLKAHLELTDSLFLALQSRAFSEGL